MTMATINDLYQRYEDLCGSAGPVMSRDELQADYKAWASVNGVSARYEETGEAYLAYDEAGPFAAEGT